MALHLILWLLAINTFAVLLYWQDKRSARNGGWRTPESVLLLVGLVGGTPGSFIAQRMFRHKTRKFSFQAQFWAVVVLQLYLIAARPAAVVSSIYRLFG